MAKKKALVASAAASALATQSPKQYEAISQIATLAKPYGENVTTLLTVDTVDKGVEVLARVRAATKSLDALHKETIKELKTQIDKIGKDRKGLLVDLEAADEAVAARLIDLYVTLPDDGREALERRMSGALGSSATVVPNGYNIEVVAEDAIPEKFFKRVVDTDAIKKALEAGEAVPGVQKKPKFYITTRATELVK